MGHEDEMCDEGIECVEEELENETPYEDAVFE